MEVSISRSDLLALIGKVQNVVPVKPPSPILSNILLEAGNGTLTIYATDRTTSIKCHTPATVIKAGAATLPAKKLFSLIRELVAPEVKIRVTNNIAEITARSSKFKLNGMDKDDFPTFPETNDTVQLSIPSLTLKEALIKAFLSAGRDSIYYILNGIHLKIDNRLATFFGSDGKRISKVTMDVDLSQPLIASYSIPAKGVEEMISMLDESDAKISLFLSADKVFLQRGNTLLISKLLSGQFPDVNKHIPEQNPIAITLHREELITLLRQLSIFTQESVGASVRFLFKNGELELNAANSEIGEGSVSMPVNYSGELLEISFNPFYFLDVLRHSKCETLLFLVKDPHTPGVIKDSTSSLFSLMPMRYKGAAAATKEAEASV